MDPHYWAFRAAFVRRLPSRLLTPMFSFPCVVIYDMISRIPEMICAWRPPDAEKAVKRSLVGHFLMLWPNPEHSEHTVLPKRASSAWTYSLAACSLASSLVSFTVVPSYVRLPMVVSKVHCESYFLLQRLLKVIIKILKTIKNQC